MTEATPAEDLNGMDARRTVTISALVASLHALSPAALLPRTACALPLAGAFVALIVAMTALSVLAMRRRSEGASTPHYNRRA
jgi:hypothetical protein